MCTQGPWVICVEDLQVIRQLMGWINTIPADATSIQKALNGGDSIGLFPGWDSAKTLQQV